MLRGRVHIQSFQAIVYPLIILLFAVYLAMEWYSRHSEQHLGSGFLACHIAAAIAGEMLALSAAVVALFYIVQRRFLKEKHFAKLILRLPALDLWEDLLVVSLSAGFLFLTVALLSGGIFLLHLQQDERSPFTVKLVWALSVWIWYFAAWLVRAALRFSTIKLAQMSLLGFLLLVGAYFGFIF